MTPYIDFTKLAISLERTLNGAGFKTTLIVYTILLFGIVA